MYFPEISDGEDKSSALKNCIRKNYKHLRKWAKRTETNAFRLYDRDIKEYPIILDYYDTRFAAQYISFNPDSDDPGEELQAEVSDALHSLFRLPASNICWRTRKKRHRMEQYEKAGDEKDFFPVTEYGAKFYVNIHDYLDTGLFLDHRETRQMVKKLSLGKRVLNLFAYTCSFSVQAALGGAFFTKSVDLSNTYTDWGKNNFLLNRQSLETNQILRADCLRFLEEEVRSKIKYDIIIIDPPTISRSKKMDGMFDVQQNYAFLISSALKLLSAEGVIFFSTNSKRFVLEADLFESALITDISQKTIPCDVRNKKIHRCWRIVHR